jgi:hypothetical protein
MLSSPNRFKGRDEYVKSLNAWKAFIATRTLWPSVDCQGTITISKDNFGFVKQTVQELSAFGVNVGLNFIHANTDGGFDFFPSPKEIKDDLLTEEYYDEFLQLAEELSLLPNHLVQNMEDTLSLLRKAAGRAGNTNDCWHCKGDPYGGPSIDSDGTLRCCGYRPGVETPEMSIFDLTSPARIEEWRRRVKADAAKCPGCTWSYPRLYARYRNKEVGQKVFANHAQVSDTGEITNEGNRRQIE